MRSSDTPATDLDDWHDRDLHPSDWARETASDDRFPPELLERLREAAERRD
jgi:hypothetical protein